MSKGHRPMAWPIFLFINNGEAHNLVVKFDRTFFSRLGLFYTIIYFYIYTMKIKIIEIFSHQDYAQYSSQRSHYQAKRLTKGVDTHFLIETKCFYWKANIFYTSNFLYPHLVPAYYFSLAHNLLSFAHVFTYNSRHYLFWKDNNWHHCFMEGHIIRIIILIGRIIIDIIILWNKKQVYYF